MKRFLVSIAVMVILLPACAAPILPTQPSSPPATLETVSPTFTATLSPTSVPSLTPSQTPIPTNTPLPTTIPTNTPIPTPTQRFDTDKIGTVESNIVYCIQDGVDLKMDVYYPERGDEPWSAIIYVHGGRWISGDKTTGIGLRYFDALRDRNFLLVSINYRLVPEYPFPANIEDVKCAIRSIRANAVHYNINPLRIGLLGTSAGGHLTSLAGLAGPTAGFDDTGWYPNTSSRVQAVASLFAPSDFSFSCKDSQVQLIFGAKDCKDTAVLSAASPLTYVGGNAPPFLLIHGDSDSLVKPKHSKVLNRALSGAGAWVNFILVENAGHGFLAVAGRISPTKGEITKIIVDFFLQKLP